MDFKKTFDIMVNNTAKYLVDNELKCMVLGISGGIDSTLTACICREVSAKTNIPLIGVSLPCSSNAECENESARKTMEAFCDEYWVENLQKEYLLMKATCEQHVESTDISQGNIKARLRAIYLYNIASVRHGIVMDTDNLTEHYLGFMTISGDVFDLNAIGCLWKHEIFQMVKWLADELFFQEDKAYDALITAYNMVPTDGNGVKAGGDLAQIAPGSTFEEVDAILGEYLLSGEVTGEYQNATVDRVISRHKATEYKRLGHPINVVYRSEIII